MSLGAGERLGQRFEIVRPLGEGGMGIVYEAIDRERGARVALKTVRQLDPASLLRFKHEFRALAAIVHPSLVALHELELDGDRWFLTMELVEGATDLRSYVRPREPAQARADVTTITSGSREHAVLASEARSSFDEARIRGAFLALADGLHALHAAGKLHRDLKPANVLVRPDGRVAILDFGLVAELGDRAAHAGGDASASGIDETSAASGVRVAHPTEHDTIAGTVPYMSPEQASAQPLAEASDWYAVGTMLFEALTGALPFEGIGVLLRKQILDAPAPSELVPGVPSDLDALAVALLARDPAARPGYPAIRAVLAGRAAESSALAPPPPTFVGRVALLGALERALAAASAGRAVVVRLHGPSGAGKSTLLGRFVERARRQALVLGGACLEQESVPYKTVDGVIDSLVRALLGMEGPERSPALEGDLGALVRIFPVVARVSGSSPTSLSDARAVRAAAIAQLGRLLAALSSARPIVVTIDDLQWGDAEGATLVAELIAALAERPVLFVLGHRSEYESRSEALRALLGALGAGAVRVDELDVGMLTADEARALARARLGADAEEESVERVVSASEGLPWLVHDLALAVRAGLPVDEIRADRALLRRAERLDEVARRVLDVVALAGRPIAPRAVQSVLGLASLPPEVMRPLRTEGFIRGTGSRIDDPIEPFHDRVREGIASRLEGEPRRALHRALARVVSDDVEPEWKAAHLEAAGEHEEAAHEHERAADLALQVLAIERAERSYRRALELVGPGEVRARTSEKLVHLLTDQARFAEAYELGRAATGELGIELPARFEPPLFAARLVELVVRLRGRPIESLVDLPPMRDPELLAAVRMMAATMKAAYQVRPELCIHLANITVSLCLRHGQSPDAAIGYMAHGAIFQGGIVGRHPVGHAFGRLALELVDRFENEKQRAEVCFVVGYFGTSWMRPAIEAEALFAAALEAGLRTADHFHSGCAVVGTVLGMHLRGAPLEETVRRAGELRARIAPFHVREAEGTLDGIEHALTLLRGGEPTLDAAAHEAALASYGSQHFALTWFLVMAQVSLLRGEPRGALAILARAEPFRASAQGMLHGAELELWRALALATAADSLAARVRVLPALLSRASSFARWARDCQANFGAKSLLLSAEVARARGARGEALERYRRAAERASSTGHRPIEAMAHARAATLTGEARERARARTALDAWGAVGARDAL